LVRTRTGLLALLAVFLMGSGGELGLWRAALPLGHGDATHAATRGDAVAHLLRALEGGIEVDPATEAWLEDLRDCLLELDLERAWKRLPDIQGDRRTVHVSGRNNHENGRYDIILGASVPSARATFGDLQGHASLTPRSWDKAPAFVAQGAVAMSTNDVAHPTARDIAGTLLAAIEEAQSTGSLDARLRTDLPHTMAFLDKVITFDSLARSGPAGTTEVDIAARIDPDRLASSGYPALSRFVRRMADVADFSVSVDSRAGHLGTIWVRSPGQYGLRFHLKDGQLVPTRGDTVQLDARVDVHSATSLDLALRPRGVVRLKGTRLSVQHWTVPLRYRVSGETARLEARFSTLPAVDFRADGGVGGWMVAAAGNAMGLEEHAIRFFRSVAEGPHGKGTLVGMQMAPTSPSVHHALSGDWHILMLDNLVVRFAAQVLGHRIVPEDDVLDELLSLEGGLVGALADDWSAARPQIAAYSGAATSSGSR